MHRAGKNDKSLQYIRDVFAQEDSELKKVSDCLNESEIVMQTNPEEGKILEFFVKLINAKKIVEIGVLAGYSTIWMARGMENDGKIYAIEKNSKRINSILNNFQSCNVSKKIELINGSADKELLNLEPKAPFDMVFIDADKAEYCNYLDWAEKNIRKGGLIIGDNTYLFGSVYGQLQESRKPPPEKTIKVMQDFNERLSNKDKYSSVLLPTFEGMTVAKKLF